MHNPFRNRPMLVVSVCFVLALAAGFGLNGTPLPLILTCGSGGSALFSLLLSLRKKCPPLIPLAFFSFAFGFFYISLRMQLMCPPDDLPRKATVSGRICAVPRQYDDNTNYLLTDCRIDGRAFDHKIRLFVTGGEPAQYGQTLLIQDARLSIPSPQRNPGGNDARITAWSQGASLIASIDATRNPGNVQNLGGRNGPVAILLQGRAKMEDALRELLSPTGFGVLRGMLFGDTSEMDDVWVDSFRATGIAHVLAVSGLHVGIIAAALTIALRPLRKRRPAALIATFITLAYCVMAGLSVSVLRASAMYLCSLWGGCLGEKTDTLTLLGCAAVGLLLINPFTLFTPSFILSFSAVLGIVAFYPVAAHLLGKIPLQNKVFRYCYEVIGVSCAAQLGVLPAQIAFFGVIPVLSAAVNLLVAPFVAAAVVTGLCAAVLGSVWLPLGWIFAAIAEVCIRVMGGVSIQAARLPFAALTVGSDFPPWIALAVVLVFAACWRFTKHNRLRAVFLLGGLALFGAGAVIQQVSLYSSMDIVFLDVGQGDAIYIRQGNTHVLLDGGNRFGSYDVGESVLLPFLRSRGVSALDAVVVSHPDSDHCGGLAAVCREIPVRWLLTNGDPGMEEPAYQDLLQTAGQNSIPHQILQAGDSFQIGAATVSVLGPADAQATDNDGSLILLAEYQNTRALFTGDIGIDTENALASSLEPIQILKVAHHGSKYSTGEILLQAAQPSLSIVSVGANNTYGHPAPEALSRLHDIGSTVLRTDQTGAVLLRVKQDGIYIDTMK